VLANMGLNLHRLTLVSQCTAAPLRDARLSVRTDESSKMKSGQAALPSPKSSLAHFSATAPPDSAVL